jgi:hypothetical protein
MLRVRLLVLVLGTMLAVTAGRAAAATIAVNTTFDGTGGNQCSLRQAILDVDSPGGTQGGCTPAAFGANTIVLGPYTYELGPVVPPGALTISPTVTKLTIQGANEGQTVIDAGQLQDRAFTIDAGATVTFSALTITHGHAPAAAVAAAAAAAGSTAPVR